MSDRTAKIIEKRREMVFLYSARESNPNGDPDDENRPRMDDEGFALVSDVRLKRTIRDYLKSNGEEILVRREYKEDGNIQSMDDLVTNSFSKDQKLDRQKILEKIPELYIDARVFGFVATVKGANCSLTGPVQFAIGKSLNRPTITTHTITSVMSGASGAGGSIGRFHILDYALFRFEGVVCPKLAEKSKMTQEDLKMLYKAMWNGTATINTRSKVNHVPQLLLAFRSKDKEFLCGELAYQLDIEEADNSQDDPILVMDKLIDRVKKIGNSNIEAIEYKYNGQLLLKYNGQEYDDFQKLWEAEGLDSISTEEINLQ
ncbi:MAG: type I-B CRISPR-associated protein Cas7/Csh2 [Candidatus Hodarchaeales archaeon]